MSDPNLVVRLIRELRAEIHELLDELRDLKSRFITLEHAFAGMSSHLFAVTGRLEDHDRRIRKLETRPHK